MRRASVDDVARVGVCARTKGTFFFFFFINSNQPYDRRRHNALAPHEDGRMISKCAWRMRGACATGGFHRDKTIEAGFCTMIHAMNARMLSIV